MSASLSEQQRAEIRAQIGDAQPATDGLIESFGRSIADRHEHKHGREDWFCMNLAAYMGEHAAPVLRRLLDVEAEVEQLRAERDQFADRVDTLTAVAKGNKRHVAELMGDLSAAQARTAELERSAAPASAPQPEEACSCMPHRKFACGHCEMDVCADCDRCCSCTCGQPGGAQ